MATVEVPPVSDPPRCVNVPDESLLWSALKQGLRPLASLKLTVWLFLAAIVIVLVGTLAQVEDDIWKVVHDYFRVDVKHVFVSQWPFLNLRELFVWIEPQLFFPRSFFLTFDANDFPDRLGFWFPKGWVIGTLMMLNLFAAHLVRFKYRLTGVGCGSARASLLWAAS